MNYTHEIEIDLGVLPAVKVDVETKWVEGEKGVWQHGRQVEPDFHGVYEVIEIYHPALSNEANHFYFTRAYFEGGYFREYVDEMLADIANREAQQ